MENIAFLAAGTIATVIATHLITGWRSKIKAEQLKEKLDDCYIKIGQQDVEQSLLQQACSKLKVENIMNSANAN